MTSARLPPHRPLLARRAGDHADYCKDEGSVADVRALTKAQYDALTGVAREYSDVHDELAARGYATIEPRPSDDPDVDWWRFKTTATGDLAARVYEAAQRAGVIA